jgi:hypothetical protein
MKKIRYRSHTPDAIYIAFYTHGTYSPMDGIWMWLRAACARWISPMFGHCQIVFWWGTDIETRVSLTFSTTVTHPSSYLEHSYQSENWVFVPVASCNSVGRSFGDLRKKVLAWTRLKENAPFNLIGYYLNFVYNAIGLSVPYDAGGKAYFCSEQVASVLVDAGLPEGFDLVPRLTTPDDVYKILVKNGAIPVNAM